MMDIRIGINEIEMEFLKRCYGKDRIRTIGAIHIFGKDRRMNINQEYFAWNEYLKSATTDKKRDKLLNQIVDLIMIFICHEMMHDILGRIEPESNSKFDNISKKIDYLWEYEEN